MEPACMIKSQHTQLKRVLAIGHSVGIDGYKLSLRFFLYLINLLLSGVTTWAGALGQEQPGPFGPLSIVSWSWGPGVLSPVSPVCSKFFIEVIWWHVEFGRRHGEQSWEQVEEDWFGECWAEEIYSRGLGRTGTSGCNVFPYMCQMTLIYQFTFLQAFWTLNTIYMPI
jgi:hypothetical protein